MRQKIVVDSSVIVKWLSAQDEKHLEQTDQLLRDTQAGKVELYSSELAKFEVADALLKGKSLKFPQAKIALSTLYQLPIEFAPETQKSARSAYQLGEKLNITYYDATFIALAKHLQVPLVTDNVKHQDKSATAKVIPLSEYH